MAFGLNNLEQSRNNDVPTQQGTLLHQYFQPPSIFGNSINGVAGAPVARETAARRARVLRRQAERLAYKARVAARYAASLV